MHIARSALVALTLVLGLNTAAEATAPGLFSRNIAHAVLAVYLNEEVYIMDNLSRTVLKQHQVSHYLPYYSINETTRWAHVVPVAEPTMTAQADGTVQSARSTR